jgi:hypothetical protein
MAASVKGLSSGMLLRVFTMTMEAEGYLVPDDVADIPVDSHLQCVCVIFCGRSRRSDNAVLMAV